VNFSFFLKLEEKQKTKKTLSKTTLFLSLFCCFEANSPNNNDNNNNKIGVGVFKDNL